MMLYKRGGVWWYEFVFKGDRIRESAKTATDVRQSESRLPERICRKRGGPVSDTVSLMSNPRPALFRGRLSKIRSSSCASAGTCDTA